MKLLFSFLLLPTLVHSVPLKNRHSLDPGDYWPGGVHASQGELHIDSSCFEPAVEMTRIRLKECLYSFRTAGIKTFNLHNEHLETGLPDLLRYFGRTTAPSDWDLHAPLLKVILDRLHPSAESTPAGAKLESVNPGLWLTSARQALAISEELLRRSKGMALEASTVLGDIHRAGKNFLDRFFISNNLEIWRQDRITSVFNEANRFAAETAQTISNQFNSMKGQHGEFDFMRGVSDTPRSELGRSLNVRAISKCPGFPIQTMEGDSEVPTLAHSHRSAGASQGDFAAFQAGIRQFTHPYLLAAEDLLSPHPNFSICIQDRGWATEHFVRKNGDDREFYDYLVGRFFVTLRGMFDGRLAFVVKIYSRNSVKHHVRYQKLGSRGEQIRYWVDYNQNEIPRQSLQENRALQTLWTSHELIDQWIRGAAISVESEEEKKAIESSIGFFGPMCEAQTGTLRGTFRAFTLQTLNDSPSARAWEGASKALRTYAILKAPETFQVDTHFRNSITLQGLAGGMPAIADVETLVNSIAQDPKVLSSIARGELAPYMHTLKLTLEILMQRTAPELIPQNLRPIVDALSDLTRMRERIRVETPRVSIADALTLLRKHILQQILDEDGKTESQRTRL